MRFVAVLLVAIGGACSAGKFGPANHAGDQMRAVRSGPSIARVTAGQTLPNNPGRLDRAEIQAKKAVDHPLQHQVAHHLVAFQKTERPLMLAHYMPWYTAKPFSNRWGWHWTMNHFDPEVHSSGKRQIASKFYPLIGPYDSGDPHVLEYHLLLMKLSGIDGVIVDWYGLQQFRDYPILHRNTQRLMQQAERLQMKFVICYEDQTIPALVQAQRLAAANRVSHAAQEIDWLIANWFKSASYVHMDEKPVLLSFGHTGLNNGEWSDCLARVKTQIAYFSQDIRRTAALGGFGWPSPQRGLQQVESFAADSKQWPHAIPAAFPRFIDIYKEAKTGTGFPRLADNDGQTLRSTLETAFQRKPRIIQIVTWNDWGEGTQIEPSHEFGYRDLEIIQQLRRQQPGSAVVRRATDLRLPARLLRLRRSARLRPQQLDAVATSISNGDLAGARTALESFELPKQSPQR